MSSIIELDRQLSIFVPRNLNTKMINKTNLSSRMFRIVVPAVFLLDLAYTLWWYIVYKIRMHGVEAAGTDYNPHAGDSLMPRFMREELFLWIYLFDIVFFVLVLVVWLRDKSYSCMPFLFFMLFYILKFSVLFVFIVKGLLASGTWGY